MPPIGKSTQPARGPGGRVRITNRSRLRIYHGSIDADNVVLEEDGSGKGMSTAGVDAEDANEHHLQVVLSLQTLDGEQGKEVQKAHIPVPDATGVVSNYESLYAGPKGQDTEGYLKCSDLVDETLEGGFIDGYTYDLDEEDLAWLEKNTQAAKNPYTTINGARSMRKKLGKDGTEAKDAPPAPFSISEPEFELLMGLFDMLCDNVRPTLHADLSTIPVLADFEETLTHELAESFFAMYDRPSNLPTPEQVWLLARAIYPHWKERKIEREGLRVMAQLNTDETSDGDAFVCFRRRDPKPVRKTRRSDTSQLDRMARLLAEMEQAEDISHNALLREQKKGEQLDAEHKVFDARRRFATVRVHHPEFGSVMEDEKYLFSKDPTAVVAPKILLTVGARKSSSEAGSRTAEHGDADAVEVVQAKFEENYRKRKLEDDGWDNRTDGAAQPGWKQIGAFMFSRVPQVPVPPLVPQKAANETERERPTVGFRTRRGRGGFVRLDRLLPHRSRTPAQDNPFTRKPLSGPAFNPQQRSPSKVARDLAGDGLRTAPDVAANLSDPNTPWSTMSSKEYVKDNFFKNGPVYNNPEMELNGTKVVDDFDLSYELFRADLFDPEHPHPVRSNMSYLAQALDYNREIRTKELKEAPLFAPFKAPTSNALRLTTHANNAATPGTAPPSATQLPPNAANIARVGQQAQAQQAAVAQAMSQANQTQQRFSQQQLSGTARAPQTPVNHASTATSASPTPPRPAPHPQQAPVPTSMSVQAIHMPNGNVSSQTNNTAHPGSSVSPVQQLQSNLPLNGDLNHALPRPASAMQAGVQRPPYPGLPMPPSGMPANGMPNSMAGYRQANAAAAAAYAAAYANNPQMMAAMQQYHRQLNGQKSAYASSPMVGGMPMQYQMPGNFGALGVDVNNMNLSLNSQNMQLKLPSGRNRPNNMHQGMNGMDMAGTSQGTNGVPFLQMGIPPIARVPSANGQKHLLPVPMQDPNGTGVGVNGQTYMQYALPSTSPMLQAVGVLPVPTPMLRPSKSPFDPANSRPGSSSPLLHRPQSVAR
ncbi:hypothetical protein DACRYDRAFT_116803 [Dacryopinax primogenitus]|uniref:Enhancer of polycomb-like protein n=1 Tax=Dacryopinax primogenitus (strain DJM 731) TaxID=1858805 RepID=M5FTF7_DACPD|nr:uncharacterized protein DACRYDRAFT_116803 [Dacryopinax primogenitus]EJU00921.1 hypothetical protein DACRYDRAFT_116803 [Dacryopinax primogenitus]